MKKSATDVMQEVLAAAILDSVAALKAASKGVPNNLLRDLNAIHANTTVADLPAELQSAISAGVRAAFAKLLKEGYSVAPTGSAPLPPRPTRDVPGHGRPQRRPPTRGGDRPPPRGDRPSPGGKGPRPGGGKRPRG